MYNQNMEKFKEFYDESDNKKTIFIPIAACQEYYIEHTIKSAMALANYPERVYFGVFNNIIDKDLSLLDNEFITKSNNIFYSELKSSVPMGTGYARLNASLMSTKIHDYMFQVDAHSIFSKGWDSVLINTFKKIENEVGSDKVVLTGQPGFCFEMDDDKDKVVIMGQNQLEKTSVNIFYNNNLDDMSFINGKPTIYFMDDQKSRFSEINIKKIIHSHTLDEYTSEDYDEVNYLSACLLFSKYDLLSDIMHDPRDYFNGDQSNYSIRLISRKYRIFSVKRPVIGTLSKDSYIDEKLINMKNKKYHWRELLIDDINANAYKYNMMTLSNNIYEDIITGRYLGYWGAPDLESLKYVKERINYPY